MPWTRLRGEQELVTLEAGLDLDPFVQVLFSLGGDLKRADPTAWEHEGC